MMITNKNDNIFNNYNDSQSDNKISSKQTAP